MVRDPPVTAPSHCARPILPTYHCSCLLNNHAGKYTISRFQQCLHPDPEPIFLRQMSQLNRGDALWFVARFYLVCPHLSARGHQGACPTPLLQTHSTRRCGLYSQGLFQFIVSCWLLVGRGATGCRYTSHFQAVKRWSNFQYPIPVAWLSFHEQCSESPSSSQNIDGY